MNTTPRSVTGAIQPFLPGRSASQHMAAASTIRLALGLPPIVVAALALPLSLVSFRAGALCLSYALGWTVLVGPCGCAYVGALNSAACRRSNPLLWLPTILAYTFCGVVSGAIVGLALGWFGAPWFSLAQ